MLPDCTGMLGHRIRPTFSYLRPDTRRTKTTSSFYLLETLTWTNSNSPKIISCISCQIHILTVFKRPFLVMRFVLEGSIQKRGPEGPQKFKQRRKRNERKILGRTSRSDTSERTIIQLSPYKYQNSCT
jgi:hypothetical protein